MDDKIVQWFNPEELARTSLNQFMLYTDPYANSPGGAYVLKDFHKKITSVLEKVERWEIKKLMINVPPQHGKSSVSSVWYAAMTLWKNPYQNVGLCSYSAELSEWFSRKTRELVKSPAYIRLFGNILEPTSQSITEWNTTKGWSYRAVGVGGSFTGKPADKILIDDPHKDQEEANSPLMRNKVREWYTSVVLSRVHVNTAVVIIMTRWHEDDLCWRLLEREPDEWTVLNIPIFNDDWTVIRPEKHPKELVEKKRRTIGESMFQAMYMWDPINEWGWAFKQEYFQWYENSEILNEYCNGYVKDLQVVTFVDPAISQKQTADDTSICTIGLDKKNNMVYLIDLRRGKMLPDEIISHIFEVVNKYHPNKVGIETNAFQKMLEIEIRKEMRKRNTFFLLEGQTSSMNKEAKIISALQPRYSNLTILHPKRWANIDELQWQLLKFPNGKHDDCIDALSMAVMMLNAFSNTKKTQSIKANWINWEKDKKKIKRSTMNVGYRWV